MNTSLECDTEKIKETAKSIQNIAVELKTDINKMYKLFDEMTLSAWTGTNAKNYARTVLLDKQEYLDYIEDINKMAKEMLSFSEKIEDDKRTADRLADNI